MSMSKMSQNDTATNGFVLRVVQAVDEFNRQKTSQRLTCGVGKKLLPKKAASSIALVLGNLKPVLESVDKSDLLVILSFFTFCQDKKVIDTKDYLPLIMEELKKARPRGYDPKALLDVAKTHRDPYSIMWMLACPKRMQHELSQQNQIDTKLGKMMVEIYESGGLSAQQETSERANKAGHDGEHAAVMFFRNMISDWCRVVENVECFDPEGKRIGEYDGLIVNKNTTIPNRAVFKTPKEAAEWINAIGFPFEVAGITPSDNGNYSVDCVEIKLKKAKQRGYCIVVIVDLTRGPKQSAVHLICPTDETYNKFVYVPDPHKMIENICYEKLRHPVPSNVSFPVLVKQELLTVDELGCFSSYYRM